MFSRLLSLLTITLYCILQIKSLNYGILLQLSKSYSSSITIHKNYLTNYNYHSKYTNRFILNLSSPNTIISPFDSTKQTIENVSIIKTYYLTYYLYI